jgi:hypothetical protein
LGRGKAPVEDEIIPLLPYLPSHNDKEFHEEIMMQLSSNFFRHLMKGKFKPQLMPKSSQHL